MSTSRTKKSVPVMGEHASVLGRIAPGNIDLHHRPKVRNLKEGGFSTVRSMSFSDKPGREILVPTVVGHRIVSNEEAISTYRKSGRHLGIFKDAESASRYAKELHRSQAKEYGGKTQMKRADKGAYMDAMQRAIKAPVKKKRKNKLGGGRKGQDIARGVR